jgi:hypothetical protein
MSLGVILLVHSDLDRAQQVARHWAAAGCTVVIHVDRAVPDREFERLRTGFADVPAVGFCKRFRCEWGTWGIVAATQAAAEKVLRDSPQVNHVYLASGACLPLRPVTELAAYLAARPQTDFIESATTADVTWTMGGLEEERFTLHFPFAWKRQRSLFDRFVRLQRLLRVSRRMPDGLVPHMGSQWWCLTRSTLTAILEAPDRLVMDRYFSRTWIPDESYFQTLARRHATEIESRSLTLSKFDFHGKPHVFYDDHVEMLRRSDCFVARKIWPRADGLYRAFLGPKRRTDPEPEPDLRRIDEVFAAAADKRLRGRPGLYMQSRFPHVAQQAPPTCAAYTVCHGFSEIFEDFTSWLALETGAQVHGHLFGPARAEFAEGASGAKGALSDSAQLRDYNPRAFLTNLLWNMQGERQCFQYGPRDTPEIGKTIACDPNATIWMVTGAWAIPLSKSNAAFPTLRREAARLQKIEAAHLKLLRSASVRARVQIFSLAAFLESPMERLQAIVQELSERSSHHLTEAPYLADLDPVPPFVQRLRNAGMHPYLVGDIRSNLLVPHVAQATRAKPQLVR